jgi:5S rRNA maturation endonuclease (ribonuclease M5)/archaellum biogenesis ATPase FlaH
LDVVTFARRHLGQYKQKGNEIIPVYCCFCQGGPHKDKYSLAINIEKETFNCKRGSCGRQGHYSQLLKEFGEEQNSPTNYEMRKPAPKAYKKPVTVIETPKEKVEKYLMLRGFSKETWERRQVGESNGLIVFPYFENGQPVMNKFRKAEKYDGNGMKSWREEGGKAVLWGMDLCDPSNPLVLVEGEPDCLALDECGIENVVSVPSGSKDLSWIETCWEWLEQFNQIIIWGDNDEPGKEMVRQVVTRLGDWRCYIVDSEHKDANISLIRDGKDKTAEKVFNAKSVPINGLIDLADVTPVDQTNVKRVLTGIKSIDKHTGGSLMGELTVVTGKSGQGKSTLLGQIMLESIDQGFSVCAYSGELRADRFQYWVHLQAAGSEHIKTYYDSAREKNIPVIPRAIADKIKSWYKGKFWLYDNEMNSENNESAGIVKLFTYAAKKYGAKIFLVDNLMTSKFNAGKSDSDFYRAQSNFVGELIHFAKTYNVHVYLVAHPNKTKGKLEKENISGTGDITNRADNVLSVERDEERPLSNILTILKNRSDGAQNVEIVLSFDPQSKRFWQETDRLGEAKKYGWEDMPDVIPKCVPFNEYRKEDF